MSREYVFGDMGNHALDVADGARRLLHAIEREDEGTIREAIAWIAKYSARLQSDLCQLDYIIDQEIAAENLKRNPQPATLPLALSEGGAS
jgi:hypothetical protein